MVDDDFRARFRAFPLIGWCFSAMSPPAAAARLLGASRGSTLEEVVRRRLNSGSVHVWVVIRSVQSAPA